MRKLLRRLVTVVGIGTLLVVGPPLTVLAVTADERHDAVAEVPAAQVALVLGAGVDGAGNPSPFLAARIRTAVELYREGRVRALLMSGDHSRVDYDEVAAMARSAQEQGVPDSAIVMDHAGFDTYSSCYRARSVWRLSEVVVVSQAFHLPRAVWLCGRAGLTAHGAVASDVGATSAANYGWLREVPAVDKSVVDVLRRRTPRFPGPREDAFDHITGAAGRP